MDRIVVRVDAELLDLAPGYIANRFRDVERLEGALAGGDWDTLRIVGHSMRGSGGAYGFDEVTRIGAAIEEAALARDAACIAAETAVLRAYLERVDVVVDGPAG